MPRICWPSRLGMNVDRSLHRLMQACELRLSDDPEDPDALFAMAAVLGQMGRYHEALDFIETVSSLREDYPGLGRFRDRILREQGQKLRA